MTTDALHRLAAFTDDPAGGNPAGVWIGDTLPSADSMQRIAREVGYSETAFVAPASGSRRQIRYYSPEAEVPFCGHATIATGVQLGHLDGVGEYVLTSTVGDIPVVVTRVGDALQATLESITPRYEPLAEPLLNTLLGLFSLSDDDLDTALPPAVSFAGAFHGVIALRSRATLSTMRYDFDALRALMLEHDLTTIQLVYRRTAEVFDVRNAFAVGGVVEDPATGAAAAALGGYLRDAGLVSVPADLLLHQGDDMGRPSVIQVQVPEAGGIRVSGTAVAMR